MPTPTWPVDAGFPQFALLGGEGGPDEKAKIVSDVAIGRPRRRQRFANPSEFYSLSVLIESLEHLEIFEEFYKDTLENGVLEFDWTHPDDSGRAVTCVFDGTYRKSCQVPGRVYKVSFTVEILP